MTKNSANKKASLVKDQTKVGVVVKSPEMRLEEHVKAIGDIVATVEDSATGRIYHDLVMIPVTRFFTDATHRVKANAEKRRAELSAVYYAHKAGGEAAAKAVMQSLGREIDLGKFIPAYEAMLRENRAKRDAETEALRRKAEQSQQQPAKQTVQRPAAPKERAKDWLVKYPDGESFTVSAPSAGLRCIARKAGLTAFFEGGNLDNGRFLAAKMRDAYGIATASPATIAVDGKQYSVTRVSEADQTQQLADVFAS